MFVVICKPIQGTWCYRSSLKSQGCPWGRILKSYNYNLTIPSSCQPATFSNQSLLSLSGSLYSHRNCLFSWCFLLAPSLNPSLLDLLQYYSMMSSLSMSLTNRWHFWFWMALRKPPTIISARGTPLIHILLACYVPDEVSGSAYQHIWVSCLVLQSPCRSAEWSVCCHTEWRVLHPAAVSWTGTVDWWI